MKSWIDLFLAMMILSLFMTGITQGQEHHGPLLFETGRIDPKINSPIHFDPITGCELLGEAGKRHFNPEVPRRIDSAWYPGLTWTDKGHLNQRRAFLAVVTVGQKMYAIGGSYGSQWLSSVEAYDPSSDSWTYVAPMPTARTSLAAGVIDGKIYVIGGTANYQVLNTVEIYDPVQDSWSTGAPKPTGVAGLAVAVAQGRLWALGGTRGWLDYRDNVEIYDPVADTWEIRAPLPIARVFAAATAIDDRIYITGGYNYQSHFLDVVHCCPVGTGAWTTVSPMLIGRDAPAAAVVAGGILVLGGRKEPGVGSCPDVEFFDPVMDEWNLTTSLPEPRANLGCGVLDGFPYAVAGTPNPFASVEATNFQGLYLQQLTVVLDIKPRSCPNPLNVKLFEKPPKKAKSKKGGVLPVAVLGATDFDVHDIDISTLLLEGVAPLRHSYEDVASPVDDGEECECTTAGPDGYVDLTLKFEKAEIVAALGSVSHGDVIPLTLTGELLDGTPFEATDCVSILYKDLEPPAPLFSGGDGVLLGPAVPNPFNPITRISYFLPNEDLVRLSVYDVSGRLVERLVAEVKPAGEHVVEWDAKVVASGIYFYRIEVGSFTDTRKMILVK